MKEIQLKKVSFHRGAVAAISRRKYKGKSRSAALCLLRKERKTRHPEIKKRLR